MTQVSPIASMIARSTHNAYSFISKVVNTSYLIATQSEGVYLQYSITALSVLVLLAFAWRKARGPRFPSARYTDTLHALQTTLVPCQSIWPTVYLNAARKWDKSGHILLELPVSTLIEDIVNGQIELRNPSQDLPVLIQNAIVCYGHRFRLIVDADARVGASAWFLSASRVKPALMTSSRRNNGYWGQFPSIASFTPTFELAIHTSHTSLSRGSSVPITFTTCSSRFKVTDDAFVFTALPFFARKHTAQRAPTPFLMSLHHSLELLVSGPTPFAIISVHNISSSYAKYLDDIGALLERKGNARNASIAQAGIQGWREIRLLTAWEAALHKMGYLTRWQVFVQKC